MQMNFGVRQIVVLLLGLILCSASALAATPAAPTGLTGNLYTRSNARAISFYWKSGDPTTKFSAFNLYASVNGAKATIVASVPDSNGWGYYDLSPVSAGSYSFYVTAMNGNYESGPSNTVSFTVSTSIIQFKHIPQTIDTVVEGSKYTLDASASTGDTSAVTYSVSGPGSIDASTGLFSWTPSEPGMQTLSVLAKLVSDPTVVSRLTWEVIVLPNPKLACAAAYGTVKDTNGNPIKSGTITAYSATPQTPDSSSTIYAMANIHNGQYFLPLHGGGTYLFYVSSDDGFQGTWYRHGDTRSEAMEVGFKCDTIELDFVMAPPANIDTIRGFVISAKDAPKPGVAVQATITAYSGNSYVQTRTAADGSYMLLLRDDRSYLIEAMPDTERFQEQYYDMASTPSAATQLRPTGNMSGVNFILNAKTYYENVINGRLSDSLGNAISGVIYAYRMDVLKGVTTPTLVKQGYSWDGTFSFHNITPGDYILYAVPNDSLGSAAPGYYKEGGIAAKSWTGASMITITATTDNSNVAIILSNASGHHGKNKLGGTIGANGRIIKGGSDNGGGQNVPGLSGATVYALDADGNLSGYTVTDAQGGYSIGNLPAGTITVIADRIGYAPFMTTITLVDGQDGTVDVTMHTSAPAAVPTEAGATLGAASIFPNPATGAVTASFVAKSGTATISVTSTNGATLLQREIATVDGTNVLPIDLSGLASGLYMIGIRSGASSVVLPVTVAH